MLRPGPSRRRRPARARRAIRCDRIGEPADDSPRTARPQDDRPRRTPHRHHHPPRQRPVPRSPAPSSSRTPRAAAGQLPEGKAVFLCRCGHSATKPFCDSSHKDGRVRERRPGARAGGLSHSAPGAGTDARDGPDHVAGTRWHRPSGDARLAGLMPGPSRSLLRHPDFLKLWTAETISVFGIRDHAARAAPDRRDLPEVSAVRVRPAHDDRVPAVHPAQPAGGRLGGPAAPPADPDRGRPGPGGRDRLDPGRLLLRRPHDLAAVRRRLRQRLPHRLLRRRLPELPAVGRGAGPAGGGQLQAGDHPVRGADPGPGAAGILIGAAARRRSRCCSTR